MANSISYIAVPACSDEGRGVVRLDTFKATIYDSAGNRLAECYNQNVAEKIALTLNEMSGM